MPPSVAFSTPVAEGKTKRARPEIEMSHTRLAHIEIDIRVEGGG
jgi:hypothetical protein